MTTSIKSIAGGFTAAIALSTLPLAAFAAGNDAGASDTNVVRGIVTNVPSSDRFTVRDSDGRVDTVALHQGTVISPAWDSVQPGSYVTVDGVRENGDLEANAVDTLARTSNFADAGIPHNSGNSAGAPQENNEITGLGQ